MSAQDRVAIVGAGISGLAAAHVLGRTGCDVTVIERRHGVGGRIHSENCRGYLLEHGANAMISPAPAADRLIEDLDLGTERIDRTSRVQKRYLVRDGQARALAIDPLRFFTSNYFTIAGRLRFLAEPFIPPFSGDETVADFITRRFGRELLDYVFDPLVGGIYSGDVAQLGIDAIFPQLKRLEREHGGVVRGILRGGAADGRAFSPRKRKLFSFRGGLAALPSAMSRAMSGKVILGARLDRIEPCPGGAFRLHVDDVVGTSTQVFDAIVLALPAYAAARVVAPLDVTAGAALASIPHAPLAVSYLGYDRRAVEHPLDGLGALVPSRECRGILGVMFSSTVFEHRAPQDRVLLTSYVGGSRQPELAQLDRHALADMVASEIRDLLGARHAPDFVHQRYWRRGLPQPGVGHRETLATIRSVEQKWPGVFMTGNYFDGVSTGACIDSALATAEQVLKHVARQQGRIKRRVASVA